MRESSQGDENVLKLAYSDGFTLAKFTPPKKLLNYALKMGEFYQLYL